MEDKELMQPTYSDLLDQVKTEGAMQPSAHGPTKELLAEQYTLGPGEMLRRDNINYTIGYIEALQLIAGVYDRLIYQELAPNSQHILFTINMAYGPRVTLQVPRVIKALQEDIHTRRAIIFVGKPEDGPTGDQPCTTSLQFIARGHRLNTVASMRSNDLVKGLPYDGMMFSALNMAIARELEVYPGNTIITAGSAHIYERDVDRQAKDSDRVFILREEAIPGKTFSALRDEAQRQLKNPKEWIRAEGMRHLVPPLFREIVFAD